MVIIGKKSHALNAYMKEKSYWKPGLFSLSGIKLMAELEQSKWTVCLQSQEKTLVLSR